MPDMNLRPADLISRAAARIRWQQRLLCSLPAGGGIDVDGRDALGLYYTLEDIYEDLTAALRRMEEGQKA